MITQPFDDPELEGCMAAAVARGEFRTIAEARAEFWAKLDRSVDQADRGELDDVRAAWARIRDRLTTLPHAAE